MLCKIFYQYQIQWLFLQILPKDQINLLIMRMEDIEKIFKNNEDAFATPPSDAVWKRLEERLNENAKHRRQHQKKDIRQSQKLFYIAAATIAVCIIPVIAILLYHNPQNQKMAASDTIAVGLPQDSIGAASDSNALIAASERAVDNSNSQLAKDDASKKPTSAAEVQSSTSSRTIIAGAEQSVASTNSNRDFENKTSAAAPPATTAAEQKETPVALEYARYTLAQSELSELPNSTTNIDSYANSTSKSRTPIKTPPPSSKAKDWRSGWAGTWQFKKDNMVYKERWSLKEDNILSIQMSTTDSGQKKYTESAQLQLLPNQTYQYTLHNSYGNAMYIGNLSENSTEIQLSRTKGDPNLPNKIIYTLKSENTLQITFIYPQKTTYFILHQ